MNRGLLCLECVNGKVRHHLPLKRVDEARAEDVITGLRHCRICRRRRYERYLGRLRLWCRGATVGRRPAGDDRDDLVFVDQLRGASSGFFRTALVVFDDYVDPAMIDTAALIDLVSREQHAVDRRPAKVEGWSSQIAEVTNLERASIGRRGFVRRPSTRKHERHQDDSSRQQHSAEVVSSLISSEGNRKKKRRGVGLFCLHYSTLLF